MNAAPTVTGGAALGWDELAALRGLLRHSDDRVRAAAAEAIARLPLAPAAWERFSRQLVGLLDARERRATVMGIARAAAHAPVRSLRSHLRAVAQDGAHPGHRAAMAALAEVGDDLVLAGEVSRLLSRPLTVHAAARLAGLPLERLHMDAGRIRAVPRAADDGAAAWPWTAIAAARLGDVTRLDDWLRGVAGDGPASRPPAPVWLPELRAVRPLPQSLIAHLDRCLTDAPIHRVLRSAWLAPAQVAPTPERLDDLSGPLAAFVDGVITSAAFAGADLAHGALRLPSGVAPDPSAVYEAWLGVADRAAAARPYIAWTLGRAGPSTLVARLAPWLSGTDAGIAAHSCTSIRDAGAWLTTPQPPDLPAIQPWSDSLTRTHVPAPPHVHPPSRPPWPRADHLVHPAESESSAATGEIPVVIPPFGGAGLSFGTEVGAESGTESGAADVETPPAYARLSCPSAVVVGAEFTLEVGLAERPTRGVTAQVLMLPDRVSYTVTVQVVVDGFTLRQGERSTVQLAVEPGVPYPTSDLHLTAVASPGLDPVRSILAVFSVDGHTVAGATRAVQVVDTRADLPSDAGRAPATGVDTALSVPAPAADLTITISRGDDIEGRKLLWSFQSPHPSVPGSAMPIECTLGSRPDEFARGLMRAAGRAKGESLSRLIEGKATRIGDLVPAEVHRAVRAAATAVGGPPSVLLLSADPYVPWELARIDAPWLTAAPAILGAQAVVGRWALRTPGPTSEPPRTVSMHTMAVVRGSYEGVVGFKRLVHAEQEADDLNALYGAALVDADEQRFFACLDGEPPADVLHFAMHGKFDPTGLQDGLILIDGVVEPDMIIGSELMHHPFVFLNACQVGQAGETLGQYGGMAQAFVEAGASAVVAPLWAVQDDVARDVSLRFYDAAFSGISPGEFLRSERAQMRDSGTHLAYVLYGHPALQLTRSDPRAR